jgi:hypothetical protein
MLYFYGQLRKLSKEIELQDGKVINANQFINKAGTYIGGEL